ncbi:frataxin, mitochondrial [Magnolia sinica]|uniref:frataxin, mitochondrial n=1 Tax=Magnolia sinica TaxID=86752 RepID=UPI0026594BAC|nr:frataxin, mitochondrial [Magnolia sinica]
MAARLLMARMRKCLVSLPLFKPPPSGYLFSSSPCLDSCKASSLEHEKVSLFSPLEASRATGSNFRAFCSRPLNLDDAQGPAAIDYRSILPEDEFHRLADETIHDLQEKIEEYGDCVQLDGFDIDYGNEVLTLKLGSLGTYVLNKQTPNRQIWLSSPVSGPSRFDWDGMRQAWVYRRTKENLQQILETEIEQLCGKPINLS